MATKKMGTTSKTKVAPKAASEPETTVVVDEAAEEKAKIKEVFDKKKRADTDLVPCVSVTAGELLVAGDKSKNLYSWTTDGDEVGVEYRDLISAIRSKKPCIFKPRFIIQDDDVVAQYPELQEVYDSLYSKEDLKSIFQLSPSKMGDIINRLPDGAKDTIKTLAMTSVDDGSLDSVQRIRVIDQIFGTDMLLKLAK